MKALAKTESGYVDIDKCKNVGFHFDENKRLVIYEMERFNKVLVMFDRDLYLQHLDFMLYSDYILKKAIKKTMKHYCKDQGSPMHFMPFFIFRLKENILNLCQS